MIRYAKEETTYGIKIYFPGGTVRCYNKQDELHNPYGPAIEHPDGLKVYYKNGVLYNPNGPAIYQGNMHAYYNHLGKIHNTKGAAIVTSKYELHFVNGKYLWKR